MLKYHLCNLFKKNVLLITLNVLAIILCFYLLNAMGIIEHIHKTVFFCPDSREYFDYAKWISGNNGVCNPYRTFFYPLVLLFAEKAEGTCGIWYLQIFLWLCSCNLIYLTVLRYTGKKTLAVFSFILTASNISLIVYTAFALTEIITFFMLSVFAFSFTLSKWNNKNNLLMFFILFVISTLASIKPLFQIIWYAAILIILISQLRKIINKPLMILFLLLASTPVITQTVINKMMFNTFRSTSIADLNIRDYFYRKTRFYIAKNTIPYAQIDQYFGALPDSVVKKQKYEISLLSNSEIIKVLLTHWKYSLVVYQNNLVDYNLKAANQLMLINTDTLKYGMWTKTYNKSFYYIHLIMLCIWIYYLFSNFKRRTSLEYLYVLLCGVLSNYILYTSGITFYAGDRLIVSAIGIWGSLYVVLIYLVFEKNEFLKKIRFAKF